LFETARKIAQDLGFDITHESKGGGSDGNFTGSMGIPTLDGLGVMGNGYHTLEEYMDVASLSPRGKLMAGLLATLS
jgi:glutamate carboxypeptidase